MEINFKMGGGDVAGPMGEMKGDRSNRLDVDGQNAPIAGHTMCALRRYGKPPEDRTSAAFCKLFSAI